MPGEHSEEVKSSTQQKIEDELERFKLINPDNYPPDGHVGVYVKHSRVGGNYLVPIDNGLNEGTSTRYRLVRRPYRPHVDVIVADEDRELIDRSITIGITKGPFTTDRQFQLKVLHAINNGFAMAEAYAEELGVPVDLKQTHSDATNKLDR